jgi:predicted phosphate transport protein (TIGR00153 family)
MRLLPREEKFFALFLDQATIIRRAATLLVQGVEKGNSELQSVADEIQRLEHKGDEIIHDIFTRLNQTFITPLDPEDIHSLASHLDDVLDGIEDSVARMVMYDLEPIPATVIQMSRIVDQCSVELEKAIKALNTKIPLLPHCIEINRLEDEADTVLRKVISDIFRNETDPIRIIKQKEVHELLEQTTDRCEDIADVLQAVVVKNS